MKKFIIILMALMLLISNALADTDNEIVFHGIPWGISVNELVEQLRDREISVNSRDIASGEDMAIWTYQFHNSYQYDIESTGHKILVNYLGNSEAVRIAGYPVNTIEMYAHYDITDGVLKVDSNNSKYYFASIWFDVSDEMAVSVYAEINRKLSALYGTCEENSAKISNTTYTYSVWNGANKTAVCLYRSASASSTYQHVNLMYGKTDCEKTLHEVRRLVIEHEIQSVADDSTGL